MKFLGQEHDQTDIVIHTDQTECITTAEFIVVKWQDVNRMKFSLLNAVSVTFNYHQYIGKYTDESTEATVTQFILQPAQVSISITYFVVV